eukprot:g67.t1
MMSDDATIQRRTKSLALLKRVLGSAHGNVAKKCAIAVEEVLFNKHKAKEAYLNHVRLIAANVKRNAELRSDVLQGILTPEILCGMDSAALASQKLKEERRKTEETYFTSQILTHRLKTKKSKAVLRKAGEGKIEEHKGVVVEDKEKLNDVENETCRFNDVDGTRVGFRVKGGGLLDELMDGYIVNRGMKEMVVYRERGVIDDGTDENITVTEHDRSRVFAWLAKIKNRVTCRILFRTLSPQGLPSLKEAAEDLALKDADADGYSRNSLSKECDANDVKIGNANNDEDDDDVPLASFEKISAKVISSDNTPAKKKKKKKKAIQSSPRRSKRRRSRNKKNSDDDEEDSAQWETYYTEKDDETLEYISKTLNGNPSVEELIARNIDTYPSITAHSRLHIGTAIFIEKIEGTDKTADVEAGDLVFVKWPAWGETWYECIVGDGEDVPFVIESAPDAEPMFAGSYAFWPRGKEPDGCPADHIWAWEIPSTGVGVAKPVLGDEIKVVEEVEDTSKNAKRRRAEKRDASSELGKIPKKKKRVKSSIDSRSVSSAGSSAFRIGSVRFFFRDRKLNIDENVMMPSVHDASARLKDIFIRGLKRIVKTSSNPSTKKSIREEWRTMLDRLKSVHVAFFRMGDPTGNIGRWKIEHSESLQRTLEWAWKHKNVAEKALEKSKSADVFVRVSLGKKAASEIRSSSVVRKIDPSVVRAKAEERKRARKTALRRSGHPKRVRIPSPKVERDLDARGGARVESPSSQPSKKGTDEARKIKHLQTQLVAKDKIIEALRDDNAHYKSIIKQGSDAEDGNDDFSFNEKWGTLYSHIAMLREALRIDNNKKRFQLRVGPGSDDEDTDDDGQTDIKKMETRFLTMRRRCPSSIAIFMLDRICDIRKYEMLHSFHTTLWDEEDAIDEGGVTKEAMTLAMGDEGLPSLRLGELGRSQPLFVRVGEIWLPNPDLRVKLTMPASPTTDVISKTVPLMVGRSGTEKGNHVDAAIVPLPSDRDLLHRLLKSINSTQYWLAGISSTGKTSTICESVLRWPLANEWGKCRWFEAIGRLFAYAIINRIPIPSSILPDVLVDYLLDIEPKMQTKISIAQVLGYLEESGYNWVRVAFNDPKRKLVHEITSADEDLAKFLNEDASDHDAVRLLAQKKLIDCRRSTLAAIKRGFEFLPVLRSLSLFTKRNERRNLISGMEQLTHEALLNVTSFEGFPKTSEVRALFRRVLVRWEKEDTDIARRTSGKEAPVNKLKNFLQFVTGLRAITEGTSITISNGGSTDRIPTTKTCTSTMTLADYDKFDALFERLDLAIRPENSMMKDDCE